MASQQPRAGPQSNSRRYARTQGIKINKGNSVTIQYVNLHGQPLAINPDAPKRPAKKVVPAILSAKEDRKHMGWRVTGYPPEMVEAAGAAHERANKDKPGAEPFDFVAWPQLAGNRLKAARAKNYSMPGSAAQCADLLVKAGWLGVRSEEIIK